MRERERERGKRLLEKRCPTAWLVYAYVGREQSANLLMNHTCNQQTVRLAQALAAEAAAAAAEVAVMKAKCSYNRSHTQRTGRVNQETLRRTSSSLSLSSGSAIATEAVEADAGAKQRLAWIMIHDCMSLQQLLLLSRLVSSSQKAAAALLPSFPCFLLFSSPNASVCCCVCCCVTGLSASLT